MNRWKTESSLEEKISNLPDKRPPADLRKRIMLALPEYREPWYKRMLRLVGPGPVGYRAAVVMVSLVLTFYGGMRFDRFFQGSPTASTESLTVTGNMNDEALFYLGRSLLAAGQSTEALKAFSRAELLQPDNPRYPLWKGKAYRALGALDKERQTYRQLVSKRPDVLPARLQLAGNLLEDGQALEAQQLYEAILAKYPREKTALYNRAIALGMQGNPKNEAEAWRSYLEHYRTGDSASEALQQLQDLGDYSFRKYQLGSNAVILNQECLLDPEGHNQKREVEHLVRHLNSDSLDKVSIVVFIQNDAQRAKTIAQSLQKAIAGTTEGMGNDSVGLSWFDKAEPVDTADKGIISLSKGVLIFSTPKDNRDKEKTI
jgi:tetratricopeptide (TPR) repeat protein